MSITAPQEPGINVAFLTAGFDELFLFMCVLPNNCTFVVQSLQSRQPMFKKLVKVLIIVK